MIIGGIKDTLNYKFNCNNKKFYIVNPLHQDYRLYYSLRNSMLKSEYIPIFVLTDEGLSTYYSNAIWNEVKKLDQGKDTSNSIKKIILALWNNLNRIFRNQVNKKFPAENRNIFLREKNRLIPNTEVIKSYKRIFKFYKRKMNLNIPKDCCLIITQPWSENNQISKKAEIDTVESIIRNQHRNNRNVVLKPHPRENSKKYDVLLDKYDIEILSNRFAVEDLIHYIKPHCVVGYNSTALVTARLFYDTESFSIIDIFGENVGVYMNHMNKEFKENFHDYTTFLKKIDEI